MSINKNNISSTSIEINIHMKLKHDIIIIVTIRIVNFINMNRD